MVDIIRIEYAAGADLKGKLRIYAQGIPARPKRKNRKTRVPKPPFECKVYLLSNR